MNDNKNNKNKKTSYIFTKETMGMTLMLFCAIVLIMLLTYNLVFAGIGKAICTFMYGTFGYGSWLIIALLAYLGEWLVFGRKITVPLKKAAVISLTSVLLFFLFHAVSSRNIPLDGYGSYIAGCYTRAAEGYSGYTAGGVISAIFVYPVARLTTFIGAYVIYSVLAVAGGYLIYLAFRPASAVKTKAKKTVEAVEVPPAEVYVKPVEPAVEATAPQYVPAPAPAVTTKRQYVEEREETNEFSGKNLGRKILFEKGEFAAESYRRNMIFNENSYFNSPSAALASEEDYLRSFSSGNKPVTSKPEKSYSESYREEVLNKPSASPVNYIYGEQPATELDDGYEQAVGGVYPVEEQSPAYGYENEEEKPEETYSEEDTEEEYGGYNEPVQTYEEMIEDTEEEPPYIPPARSNSVGFGESSVKEPEEVKAEEPEISEKDEDESDVYKLFGSSVRGERRGESSVRPRSNAELFDDIEEEGDEADIFGRGTREQPAETRGREVPERGGLNPLSRTERTEKPAEKPVEKQEEKPKHVWKKYVRPDLSLLDDYPENTNVNTGEIEDNKHTIVETLARFKIASEVSNVTIGPTITRYDVIIEDKTNIKKALNYRDAVAMELRKENVNAYLNYAKGAISIEVPNNKRSVVGLKTMLANPKFINSKSGALVFGLGKNVEGEVICPDITKMPHLLVAGTTGSGKSICLSALLISLLYKYGPEELRLILVDPKQVEFISYDKLPHLMINEILYECDKAIKALNWAIKEMEHRYSLFKEMTEAGVATKNLEEYNAHLPQGEEKLPKIVIVLDEFGDLMLQAKKDIESRIIKLVQKARACGIHLILATQRPSVDCITGLIKSNLPTRIGFKVNSFDDARTIFDIGGAEKLLGRGDMYFRSAENPELTRIQGCFVDTHEVQKVTDFIKAHNETYFDQSVSDYINTVEQEETQSSMGGGDGGEDGETKIDDTFIKALKYCVTSNQASVSMIQRRFPVGYIKACKIIDWMENMNYITQSEGSKPRKVILSREEFERIYGDDVDD